MNVYDAKNIRNIVLLGHAGSGKTTFSEDIIFHSGAINRRGTIEDHNTVSDFNEIEHEKGCTIFGTPLYVEYNNSKINILDTPGYDDYIGEIVASIRVADTAMIVLNSQNGLEVGTEIVIDSTEKEKKPVAFILNKMDIDQANFEKNCEDLKSRIGHGALPLQFPIGKGAQFNTIVDLLSMSAYKFTNDSGKSEKIPIPASEMAKAEKMRSELVETIAENDEDLMTKYFDEGSLPDEDILKGLKSAIINRQVFPILCSSSKNNIGIDLIMNFITNVLPSPLESQLPVSVEENLIPCNASGQTGLFIFKVTSEAHLGDMTFFRVYSGTMKPSVDIFNETNSASERFGQLFVTCGKKRSEVTAIQAGDIGATVKLKNTKINDTLHEKGWQLTFPKIAYPNPKVRAAVVPKTKGEEEKVGVGLSALASEDPSLVVEHSQELRQIILYAQGELHLGIAKWRLEHRYKVEAEYIEPRVPYRETIQKAIRGSYRHKKQSGGAGQFAEVHMIVEPYFENMPNPAGISVRGKDLIKLDWGGNLEYLNCIVGGVIDQRFLPAILKGVMDKMHFGPLTGSYVRDIRVSIFDGKMHPVDSNEAAFKTAGMMAFKECFVKADPKILEPVYKVEIKVPEDHVGDVMSDLPSRRGLILGIDSEGRYQKIIARMPLVELDKYSTGLRSMTAGRATFTQEFAEYQAVPPNVQMKLIEDFKKHQTDEE
ncbi:MAG: elongation factor G [Candidatus Kapabacteria bacterium]|nr:elongation factor G [Candidatus Kapabacteria bacterium]